MSQMTPKKILHNLITEYGKNLEILNYQKNVERLLISMLFNSKRGKIGQPRCFFEVSSIKYEMKLCEAQRQDGIQWN